MRTTLGPHAAAPAESTSKAALHRHYEAYPESDRLIRSRVRRLEFETTLHLLHTHIPPTARIVELGAGHGAYARHFAQRGHQVAATDLVEVNVAAIRRLIADEGLVGLSAVRADACDLAIFAAGAFDAVLCLGPYYHLKRAVERQACLAECRRIVSTDGIVAVSHINPALAVCHAIQQGEPLTEDAYTSLMATGLLATVEPNDFFGLTYFSQPDAVVEEARACGLEPVAQAAADGLAGLYPAVIEALDADAFGSFRGYHRATCAHPGAAWASAHCLTIFRPAG